MRSNNFAFTRLPFYTVAASLVFGIVLIAAGEVAAAPLFPAGPSGNTSGRTIKATSANAVAGGEVTVAIELESQGDEVAASFTVNFDPAKLNTPVLTLGSGVPSGTALTVNLNQASNGKIGMLLDSMNAFAAGPGRQMVLIRFSVAPTATDGPTEITFGSAPTPRSTSNFMGELLPMAYQPGTVTIGSASVPSFEVSGRVMTPSGAALRNAYVNLIDSNGDRRTVLTGTLGFYSFQGVESGRSYTLTVNSRKYRFASRVVFVSNNLFNVDFTGLE